MLKRIPKQHKTFKMAQLLYSTETPVERARTRRRIGQFTREIIEFKKTLSTMDKIRFELKSMNR